MHSPSRICSKLRLPNLQNLVRKVKAQKILTSKCMSSQATNDESLDVDIAETPDPHLYVPDRPPLPMITSRDVEFPSEYIPTKQAWLDSMATLQDEKLGIVDLHPKVFGAYPRIDLLHKNVDWQRKYRLIDYSFARTRAEMPGGGRKPLPQKGSGKARHGSIRSPIFFRGGKALGPRGPKSFFYMIPKLERVQGLCCALSVKYAQNNLYIVDSLEIPHADPQFLEDLADVRYWGFSALFVDDSDVLPRNFSVAVNEIPQYNAMPLYGLNVYSMLKHETLVLTLAAVNKLENKLLTILHSNEKGETKFQYKE